MIAALCAIAPCPARTQEPACGAPASITARSGAPAPRTRVEAYRPVLQQCRDATGATRLAIRRFTIEGAALLLTVDPATLATRLERAACWTCADADAAALAATRFFGAVEAAAAPRGHDPAPAPALMNAGLTHGRGDGSFITADLCPSRLPLDRAFIAKLAAEGPHTPVALSISGLWLLQHFADFAWLREQERSGAIDITWVNHSFHHRYLRGAPPARNYMLLRGFSADAEILETERLLIANGATPSAFFRFPGLYSDADLMAAVRANHLIVLGADGWLALSPPLRPGAIILVHANGNEPAGLRLFAKLLEKGRLPRPFRPIDAAP